jgi:hypothetical protein
MILVLLVALVLGTFGPLMWMASRGSRVASILGGIEAFLFAIGTMLTGFAGFLFWAMKCDESCDENLAPEARQGTWWHTLDVAVERAACARVGSFCAHRPGVRPRYEEALPGGAYRRGSCAGALLFLGPAGCAPGPELRDLKARAS